MTTTPDVPDAPRGWSGVVVASAPVDRPALSALDNTIAAVEDIERMIHALTGWRTVLLDAARTLVPAAEADLVRPASDAARAPLVCRDAELAYRAFVADVACALRLPEQTVLGMLEDARSLVHDLPSTLASLRGGAFSYAHARVIVEQTSDLEPDARAAVEAAALPRAATSTVASLRRYAQRARERVHPEALTVRHARAAEKRCVHLEPAADGMAWLSALLPAADGHAIMDRLDAATRQLAAPDEPRTMPQLRADVLTALLLDDGSLIRPASASAASRAPFAKVCAAPVAPAVSPSAPDRAGLGRIARGIVPRVSVTVPVLTLLGEDLPGELDGYGPIDAATARELVGSAPSLTRILTHPETGTVLSVGREQYTVPADLRRWLVLRDGTCRFPGCGRRAVGCDVDHTIAFVDGGETDAANLAHLCRRHHRLKHETSWHVVPQDEGVLAWISPTGRLHSSEPETPIPGPPPRTPPVPKPPEPEPPPF